MSDDGSATAPRDVQEHDQGHGGHSWMMIACCIPMIIIAIALVAAGAVSPGFLLVAGLCVGMMALMMRGMDHDDHAGGDHRAHAGHGRRDSWR